MANSEQQKADGEKLETIRTFAGDVEKIIKEGGSLEKIALAEEEKRLRRGGAGDALGESDPSSFQKKLVVWTSLILVFLGLTAIAVFIFIAKTKDGRPVPLETETPLLTTEKEKAFSLSGLSRDEIIRALVLERDHARNNLGSVENFLLIEKTAEEVRPVSIASFLEKLDARAPAELVRSLKDRFALGLHSLLKNEPFLILKVSYYQNAFAAMLDWENDLEYDLGPIFIPPEQRSEASTTAEVIGKQHVFSDAVLQNYDARVLQTADGETLMLYSFINTNTLVVTTNPDTLVEISRRALAGRLTR